MNWECQDCGNSVDAPIEPSRCPCGSKAIEASEDKSKLEEALEDLGVLKDN